MNKEKKVKKTTIGGQALIEGILMRGPKRTMTVVRKADGELVKKMDNTGTNSRGKFCKLPFIRGIFGFWDSMKYGVSAINYSASFFEEEENPGKFEKWLNRKLGSEKLNKLIYGVALMFGILIPIILFFLLPTFLAGFLGNGASSLIHNLIEGLIRIVIFLAFIMITSLQKDVRRTYMYHGAEHKTIHCYEKGMPLTVENTRIQSRLHPRCGTSFLFVVMIISILVLSLFTWSSPLMRAVLRLVMLPVIVGVSYEINRQVGRHEGWFSSILRAPGLFLQRFTTAEPDDSMIEVGIAALSGVIPENDQEDIW